LQQGDEQQQRLSVRKHRRLAGRTKGGQMKQWILRMAKGGVLLLAGACSAIAAAEPSPPLWGYGVKSCDDYARAWVGGEEGVDIDIAELRRYRDWLSGFVSGLNLATGRDVLAGADIEGAMRRIHLYCDEHRKQDVFAASMDYIKGLSLLR
jgi:hypothetical protein